MNSTGLSKAAFGCGAISSGAISCGTIGAFALSMLLMVTGCATTHDPAGKSMGDTVSSAPAGSGNLQPAAAGKVQDSGDDLMRELTLGEQEKLEASKAATRAAEKLISELRHQEAENTLTRALRMDPSNQKARELLNTVLLILGDERGEISGVARGEAERARAARRQSRLELERMYVNARNMMQEGEYDKAVTTLTALLERIRWYPYNMDLTTLRTNAQESKQEADRQATEQARMEKRELERSVRDTQDSQRRQSLRFVRNRIDRLMERVTSNYSDQNFDEVIELCDKVVELDRNHREAIRYRSKAREMGHLHAKLSLLERHSEEWDRTFLSQRESEIPYHKLLDFPNREAWGKIRKKSLDMASAKLRGRESSATNAIELKLRMPVEVEFPDQPFEEVMSFLQDISGINFVLTAAAREALEESEDPVNLAAVKNLPLKSVLTLVLESREPKFGFVIKNGAVLVGPAESLHNEYYLEFYQVQDLTKPHPDFKAPKLALDEEEGSDSAGGGGGSAISLGDDEEAGTTVDGEVIQELVEKTLWPGEDNEPEEGESVEFTGGKLVVRTSVENHQKVAQLLQSLRKSTGVMVTVESRFLDLQDNFLQSIGINFGNPFSSNLPNPINDTDGNGTQISPGYEFVDAQGQTNVRAAVYNAFSQPLGTSVSPFQLTDRGGFALQYNVLDDYILEAILEANAKTQEFKKLDAPRVTAFNGQISHSLVIEQSAYIKDAEVNQTGVIPVINPVIGILNAGSILQVRPTVSHDRKYVILEIEPTLAVRLPSRFQNLQLNLTSLNVELPVLSVTKIKTTVTVPDNGTVLVGGLKRSITQNQHVGVPWVNNLPVLNLLWGRKGESRMQSNLFVLIHAKITVVRDEETALYN